MLLVLLLVAYESVRRSAAARDVVACLFWQVLGLASFGLLQHSNDRWKVPSLAQRFMRVEALSLSPHVALIERRADATCQFFWGWSGFFQLNYPRRQHRNHCSGLQREGWYKSQAANCRFRFQPVRRLPGLAAVPQGAEGLLLRYIRVVSHKHQLLLTPPFTNYCLVPSSSPSWVHP